MLARTLSALAILTALPAQARPLESHALYQRGRAAYEDGRFDRSLRLLSRARLLAEEPAQIGKIELYLGLNRYVVRGQRRRAERHFVEALRNDPRLRLDPALFNPALVQGFARVRDTVRGGLAVISEPPGAEVAIDGERRGRTPLTLELPVGEHRVVLRHEDKTREQTALVRWNERAVVIKHFTAPGPQATPATLPPKERPKLRPRRRLWTWIVGGLSLAATGAAVGVLLSAKSDHDEFLMTQDPGRYRELKGRIENKSLVSGVAFASAGAAAVGAVLLYLFEDQPRHSERRLSLRPVISVDLAGVGLGGAF